MHKFIFENDWQNIYAGLNELSQVPEIPQYRFCSKCMNIKIIFEIIL